MRTASLADRLGEFTASIAFPELPAATLHAVRRHTLDTLGAAIAGAHQPEPLSVLAAGQSAFGTSGKTALWGTSRLASPALAALVNGTAAHALELDDASGCDHSGAVVVPAVLAALDLPGCLATEEDVVAAIVAGYDVGRRVMEASGGYDGHNGAGWHSTGTCGVFGATAAVARVLGCDAAVTANAFGIAGSFASGTWAFLADGAMTKRLHPGHAASAGVLAVGMSRAGLSGPSQVFEAPWGGFFPTYVRDTARPERLVTDLGRDWRIHLSSIKPFASCRGTHAAVEAVLALRSEFQVDHLSAVTVTVTSTVEKMCRSKDIETFVDAQMSLPYAVAVAALHGAASVDLFDAAHRSDPRIRALAQRVELRIDDTLPSNVAARVAVACRDGRHLELAIDVPLGSPGNPLPQDELLAKFHALADGVLGPERARELAQRTLRLGSAQRADDLTALTRTAPPPRNLRP